MCIKFKGGITGLCCLGAHTEAVSAMERKEMRVINIKAVVVRRVGGEGLWRVRITQGAPGVLAIFCSLI